MTSLTENGALAFESSGDVFVDFFTSVVRNTTPSKALESFQTCWNASPSTAVQLLLNLRSVKSGKGEKFLGQNLFGPVFLSLPPAVVEQFLQEYLKAGYVKDLVVVSESLLRVGRETEGYNLPATKIIQFLSSLVQQDASALQADPTASVSLTAKWLPTENGPYPLTLRLLRQALRLNMKEYRVLISSLRKRIGTLERALATHQTESIVFTALPAICHRKNRTALSRKENSKGQELPERVVLSERYAAYKQGLTAGTETIKSMGSEPHILTQAAEKSSGLDPVIEAQWKTLVEALGASGKFSQTQAVVDVSGSMSGEPVEVAVALGLIVSELTEEPFKNKVITFHEHPSMFSLTGTSLGSRVRELKKAPWGGNTDLFAVFKLLVTVAQTYSLRPEQMVKTLFIFTDMQFDACGRHNETTYQAIQNLYGAAGYEVPSLVFWNLRDSVCKAIPVIHGQIKCALISGFSPQMLKLFLDGDITNPLNLVKKALECFPVLEIPEGTALTTVSPVYYETVDKLRPKKHWKGGENSSETTED
jgi:Mg-chelatase subunit ChlD